MAQSQLEAKGFFAALFDLNFTSFITLRFIKVIYGILLVLILVFGLGFFVALLLRGGASIIVAIVVVPLVTLLYLIIARIYMEVIALFFRIGENTSLIAQRLGEGMGDTGIGPTGVPPSPDDPGSLGPPYPGNPYGQPPSGSTSP